MTELTTFNFEADIPDTHQRTRAERDAAFIRNMTRAFCGRDMAHEHLLVSMENILGPVLTGEQSSKELLRAWAEFAFEDNPPAKAAFLSDLHYQGKRHRPHSLLVKLCDYHRLPQYLLTDYHKAKYRLEAPKTGSCYTLVQDLDATTHTTLSPMALLSLMTVKPATKAPDPVTHFEKLAVHRAHVHAANTAADMFASLCIVLASQGISPLEIRLVDELWNYALMDIAEITKGEWEYRYEQEYQ